MPFTFAHSAAALPFRRLPIVPSALVIGTFAPDFEYFLRLAPNGHFGHTLPGTFILTLPAALLVLWIFHSLVKRPATMLMPDAIRNRLANHIGDFRFGGVIRFLLILASLLLGIATHLLWDSFTHANTWFYHHWPLLRASLNLPVLGPTPCYKVFQHGSTIVGTAVVVAWLAPWYRSSEPSTRVSQRIACAARKTRNCRNHGVGCPGRRDHPGRHGNRLSGDIPQQEDDRRSDRNRDCLGVVATCGLWLYQTPPVSVRPFLPHRIIRLWLKPES